MGLCSSKVRGRLPLRVGTRQMMNMLQVGGGVLTASWAASVRGRGRKGHWGSAERKTRWVGEISSGKFCRAMT